MGRRSFHETGGVTSRAAIIELSRAATVRGGAVRCGAVRGGVRKGGTDRHYYCRGLGLADRACLMSPPRTERHPRRSSPLLRQTPATKPAIVVRSLSADAAAEWSRTGETRYPAQCPRPPAAAASALNGCKRRRTGPARRTDGCGGVSRYDSGSRLT